MNSIPPVDPERSSERFHTATEEFTKFWRACTKEQQTEPRMRMSYVEMLTILTKGNTPNSKEIVNKWATMPEDELQKHLKEGTI